MLTRYPRGVIAWEDLSPRRARAFLGVSLAVFFARLAGRPIAGVPAILAAPADLRGPVLWALRFYRGPDVSAHGDR